MEKIIEKLLAMKIDIDALKVKIKEGGKKRRDEMRHTASEYKWDKSHWEHWCNRQYGAETRSINNMVLTCSTKNKTIDQVIKLLRKENV